MQLFTVLAVVCVVSIGCVLVSSRPEYQHNHFKKLEDRCTEQNVTSTNGCLRVLESWYNSDFKNKVPADGSQRRFKTPLENFVKLGEFDAARNCTKDYQRLLKSTANVMGWDLDRDNKKAVAKFPTVFSIWSSFNKKFRTQCSNISN